MEFCTFVCFVRNCHFSFTSRLLSFSKIFCDFIDFLVVTFRPLSHFVRPDFGFVVVGSSVSSSSDDVSFSDSDEQDDKLLKSTLWNNRLIFGRTTHATHTSYAFFALSSPTSSSQITFRFDWIYSITTAVHHYSTPSMHFTLDNANQFSDICLLAQTDWKIQNENQQNEEKILSNRDVRTSLYGKIG